MTNSFSAVTRRSLLIATASAVAVATVPVAHAAPPSTQGGRPTTQVSIVDDRATAETRSLFAHLKGLQGEGVLFGHQHDLTHGNFVPTPDGTASDTLAAVGDHPALFGWDTLILDGGERPGSTEQTEAQNIKALSWAFEQADARGAVNTLSAHLPNFVTGGYFNDTRGRVVEQILPGGAKHAAYNAYLDRIAAAVDGARRPDGTRIPVIFRPFHENNGGWFWWGAGHATSAEYIEIFRYTVEYLRDTKDVHNLLYAYSPNATFAGDPTNYLRTYPGDAYVDVLGYDSYDSSAGSSAWLEGMVTDLAMVVRLANERGKVPALTEFGEAGGEGRNPQWFTDLLAAIKADPDARQATFMLTWANFGAGYRSYVPYPAHDGTPAHPLWEDFVAYHDDPFTLFAADLADPFGHKTKATRNEPFLHLVTPTDRQRVTTTQTTIRARLTETPGAKVTFSVDGSAPVRMRRDAAGFWVAPWSVPAAWLDNRSVVLTVTAQVGRETLTDSAVVLLGEVQPLPAGWFDDFEGYAGDDVTLTEAYSHVNTNTTTLTTEHRSGGTYGLAYGYDVSPPGYTGIGRTVDADWSDYSALTLWLKGDGTGNGMTLQVVADGVYFEYNVPLTNVAGQDIVAPFSAFRPAPWDTANAGKLLDADRLANVSALNIYIGHGEGSPTTGTVYLDDIRAE